MRKAVSGILLALLAGPAVADVDVDVSRLRLRAHATVYDTAPTLGDVLVLTAADERLAARIADEPIAVGALADGKPGVTHRQVIETLDGLRINMARVLVSGAAACRIHQVRREAVAAAAESAQDPAPLVRPAASGDAEGRTTLGALIRAHVNAELKDVGGQAEVRFDAAGADLVDLTSPPWEFDITTSRSDPLGLREFRVLVRRDGRVQRTVQVYANVRISREVVVAARPLSLGNFIERDDVRLERRVFAQGDDLGLGSLAEVIGQQVKKFVPAGELVPSGSVKPMDLVRRSRPVTVLGSGTNIQMRLTGVAIDSGGYGDQIRVRLGDTRQSRRQVRCVVTGLGTVRVLEDTP